MITHFLFQEPIGISEAQMAKFRENVKMNESGKKLVDNYRVVQPLNGRKVQFVSTVESSAISHLITLPILFMTLTHLLVL